MKQPEKAPTDNGIDVLDNLCARYNNGELDLTSLICRTWNSAYIRGIKFAERRLMKHVREIRKMIEKETKQEGK